MSKVAEDRKTERSDSSDSEPEDDEFIVERVLGVRYNHREKQVEYLLKWKGYGDEENSWEPKRNLNCNVLIEEFHKRIKEKEDLAVQKRKRNGQAINRDSLSEDEDDLDGSIANEGTSVKTYKLPRVAVQVSPATNSKKPSTSARHCLKPRTAVETRHDSTSNKYMVEVCTDVNNCGIVKGWEPERIVSADFKSKDMTYLVKYKDEQKLERLPVKFVYSECPDLVEDFHTSIRQPFPWKKKRYSIRKNEL